MVKSYNISDTGIGMNAHLSKPIEPDRLYETMARLIAGERGRSLA